MKRRNLSHDKEITALNGLTVGDFWAWAYSDILDNRNRAVFAEFVVGAALGVLSEPRIEWDGIDLRYKNKGIEVKASAYLQSWPQQRPSIITFDISKKKSWNSKENAYAVKPTRIADCYVFCLYLETDYAAIDILDIDSWEFYVLSTEHIDQYFGDQKRIGLARLQAICEPVGYHGLTSRTDIALGL